MLSSRVNRSWHVALTNKFITTIFLLVGWIFILHHRQENWPNAESAMMRINIRAWRYPVDVVAALRYFVSWFIPRFLILKVVNVHNSSSCIFLVKFHFIFVVFFSMRIVNVFSGGATRRETPHVKFAFKFVFHILYFSYPLTIWPLVLCNNWKLTVWWMFVCLWVSAI